MISNSEWWCETNKVDAIFVCPKSCGFCAILWRMESFARISISVSALYGKPMTSARLWTVRYVERAVGYDNNDNNNNNNNRKDDDVADEEVKVTKQVIPLVPPVVVVVVQSLSDLEKQQLKSGG